MTSERLPVKVKLGFGVCEETGQNLCFTIVALLWTFGIKIGQAVALAITGTVLSLFGYMPNVVQTESANLGIRLLLGPSPY